MAATPTSAEATPHAPVRPRVLRASLVLLAAGGLGLVGQGLFFGVAAGVNVPIALGLLTLGGWLGPAGVLFAAFAAVRADPFIVACDILVALGLVGGAMASFGGRSVVARPFGSL